MMQKKLRHKTTGLSIILLLFALSSMAQENYIPGYIIKNSKDTIRGYIDYRNWEKNPDKIKFKTPSAASAVIYKPTDICEFGVQGEVYVSAIVNIEVSPIQTNLLDKEPTLKLEVDTAFLQTLITGKKSLYYFKTPDSKDNFYIKQDSVYELLICKKYWKHQEGQEVIAENKKYIGQLLVYLNDCPTINSKANEIAYNQYSLTDLFKYYYACSSTEVSFNKKQEPLKAEFGAVAGAVLTTLKFRGDNNAYLVKADYTLSANFSGGLFLNLVMPRNMRKWSLYNELLFTTYKVQGTYKEYKNANWFNNTTTEIGMSYLKINNLIRVKFPIGKMSMFINAGMSNGFAISETNFKKTESKFYTDEKTITGKAIEDLRLYEQGLVLGAGATYKRFSLEFRYETGNGISAYTALKSSTNSYFFLLGYTIH